MPGLGPGRQAGSKDNLNGVGRIGGQAGSQTPTLRPNHRKTTEASRVSEALLSILPAVMHWNGPFGPVRWRRAERYFLSRWLSPGERVAKLSSPEV